MFREFILGNNQTGLVTNTSLTAVGGENPSLLLGANNILPGESSILFGSGTATSEFVAPSATIEAWQTFFASVVSSESAATASASTKSNQTEVNSNGASTKFGGTTSGAYWCATLIAMLVTMYAQL